MIRYTTLGFCFTFAVMVAAQGQQTDTQPPAPPVEPPGQLMEQAKFDPTKAPIKEIAPGVFDIRGVKLIKADRSVSFPAVINLVDAPQEYFLVSQYGASHESIFRTRVKPIDVHVAMLLLGAKGAPPIDAAAVARAEPTRDPFQGSIVGDEVEIFVSWQEGEETGLSVSAGVVTKTLIDGDEKLLTDATWIFNGSRIHDGYYMAQINGNVISLIADQFSMINYVGPGADNDDIWRANADLLPEKETPVIVTIRLKPKADAEN